MTSIWLLVSIFFVFNSSSIHVKDGIEARIHDMVPIRGGWFGSIDREQKDEDLMTPIPNAAYAEFSNVKRRKIKYKERLTTVAEEETERPREVVKKKKKKLKRNRKKKTGSRKFVKTMVGERDKDSNLTDSKEVEKRSKPVDIIVHIKMSE